VQGTCFDVAAAVVGRRALQRAVRERLAQLKINPKKDRLIDEIDALPDTVLSPDWKEAAHEVRHIGNDGAHAEPVSSDEAQDVLKYTADVSEQLYVLPHSLAASKSRRAAKAGSTP